MRWFRYALVPATVALTFASGVADAKLAKEGEANVSFAAIGPGGGKIVGSTSDLQIADGDVLTITVPLQNLDTKNSLRNKHMREKYLEVAKYPAAVLTVSHGDLKIPPSSGDVTAEANGTMKLHGQNKPVRFRYEAKRNGDKIGVTGAVRLDMTEYGIKKPSFLGATVDRDVDVTVKFTVTDT